ncbi:Uncharacterised protein [Serratia liquefaciens]|uniref:hypothetical protein n=1 Tax=Serratia liquefaciens TaxID=614 RepID=UPI00217949DB|nr:hypothetical protein [Serratia liquefaciens]CAI1169689.1 Uncharacterised protein [Serratia liquefaciens]
MTKTLTTELLSVARAMRDYIDALPSYVVASLPTMPGFDRDWADEVIEAANREAQPVRYQYREIGEGGWRDCDKAQYDYCQRSPELDARIAPAEPETAFPAARDKSQGWKIDPEYLQSIADAVGCSDDEGTPSMEMVEAVLLAAAPPAPAVVKLPTEFISDEGVMVRLEQVMAALALVGVKYERRGDACRAAMLAQPVSQGCVWTYDEHDYKWDSGCGEAWMFSDGGPTENGVKFCQSCGKPVLLAAAPEGGNEK